MVITVFFSICLYLSFFNSNNAFWIAISILLFANLIFYPKYLLLAILFFIISLISKNLQEQQVLSEKISGEFKIIKCTSFGPIIKYQGNNVLLKTYHTMEVGDKINLEGHISEIINKSNKFDFKSYLKTKNIVNIIERPKINIINTSLDFRILFKNYLIGGPKTFSKISPLMILGLKTKESKEIYNIALKMNVVHLFVISGFHISLLFITFNISLKKMKVPELYSLWISLIPVLFYLFVLRFSLSATRAFLLLFFGVINKTIFNKKYNILSVFSVVLALMFIFAPYSVFSLSFIFTFIATFVVLFINQQNWKYKYFWVVLFAYFSNLVIAMYINNYFTLLGLLYGVSLSPIFVVVYLLSLLLFPFKEILNYIYIAFDWILQIFNLTNFLIIVPKFNINWVYGFYGFLIVFLNIHFFKNMTITKLIK